MSDKTSTSSPNFQEIIEMLIRKKMLFFVPFVSTFIIAVVVGCFLPRIYEASSIVQMKSRQMIDPLVNGIAVSPDLQQEFDALSKQVLAWPKLEQLVAQLHLADNIKSPADLEEFIKKLKGRINVRIRNNDVVEIIYRDRNPATAQQVVNTLTQNFIDENARLKRIEAQNAIDFIGEQLKIYRKKLGESQQNFSTNKIDSDLRLAVNRRTLLRERLTSLQRIVPSQVTTQQNPVVSQLQSRLGQLETELARLTLDAKEGNPHISELKSEIETLRSRISQEVEKQTVKESISTFNPLYLQAEQELKQIEMDISYLEKRRTEVERGDRDQKKQVSDEELANLQRNKQVDEDIYQMLLRQLESAYVSERLQDSEKGSRFIVLEYARLPFKPVKPKMSRIVLVGFAGGIGLGLGLVFLSENLAKSFQTASQVKEALQAPSLGSISRILTGEQRKAMPFAVLRERLDKYFEKKSLFSKMRFVPPHVARTVIAGGISPQIVIYHEPKSRVAEEFRVLRTHLDQDIGGENRLQTIVVTSALRGEGKSTTTSNLAVAMADSGKRTLLIDCDLRKGMIKEMFSLPDNTPGLSNVLSGTTDVNAVLYTSSIPGLAIIAGGDKPLKPAELLGSKKMAEVMNSLRSMFDFIILDAPPVLNLPDACILSKYGDGVMMIVQAGRTKQQDVLTAQATLKQVNAKIFGFTLTNVQFYMPKYIYDYYYES